MFIRSLLGCITLLIGLEAQALPTAALSSEQRTALGKQLAEQAGASQWQQLWQRTRHAGHLDGHANTAYFDLAPTQLIASVFLTLSQPQQTSAVKQTQVLYRRDFLPQTVGKHAETHFSAICVWVDWRTLPTHAVNRPGPYLGQISLLLARPC
ncbi:MULTISPECIES: hypothetical protein [Pseudomonas]|uniref:Uncharacterized protein n=1 Tax=Pseudomonas sp. Hg7Tf TaxID=3236988 RepID=A0AB39I9C9_9PSED|nr:MULTISPECIES: hypothetical protein [Pseudomonas]MDD1978914.1 hypothetical protein [Pseudomonas putida]MDH2558893.1 hypothetical protein [Pseudomonas sp. Hg5Tf]